MYNIQEEKFLAFDTGKSSQEGEFITSIAKSETLEFDKIIQEINSKDYTNLEAYCKLLNVKFPDNFDTLDDDDKLHQAINIHIMSEMIKIGTWISRDILTKFPDEVPVYFDFRGTEKKNQLCTDNGRLLWTIATEKWDVVIACESKNRYER